MVNQSLSAAGVRIRPIRAADRGELARFYAGLSPESRFSRFHATTHGIGDEAASLLCGPDHEHREGFVAEAADTGPGGASPGIVGHLCLEPGPSGLEMAVAVADDCQSHGIGRALLLAAVDWAAGHRIIRLQASALSTNSAVLGLIASIGRPVWESSTSATRARRRLDRRQAGLCHSHVASIPEGDDMTTLQPVMDEARHAAEGGPADAFMERLARLVRR